MYNLILSIVMILLLIYKASKDLKKVLWNPASHLVLFSIIYLSLPQSVIHIPFEMLSIPISAHSIFISNGIAFYFTSFFSIVYILTMNKNVYLSNVSKPLDILRIDAYRPVFKSFIFIISLLFILLLIFYGPKIVVHFSNRYAAWEVYTVIERMFKLPIMFWFLVILVVFNNRMQKFKVSVFIGLFILATIEGLSGGRDLYYVLIFTTLLLYLHHIRSNSLGLKHVFTMLSLVSSLFILRLFQKEANFEEANFEYTIYTIFSEFLHTGLTLPYLIEHYEVLASKADGFNYIFDPFAKFFVGLGWERTEWYSNIISEYFNRGWGLAGNPATEAYFYFKFYGVVIYPFLITIAYFIPVFLKFDKNFIGIAYFIMFVGNVRLLFRTSFLDNYFSLLIWFIILTFMVVLLKITLAKKKINE